MNIRTSIPLKDYTTMRLGGPARQLIDVENMEDIKRAVEMAAEQQAPVYILGGGSNTIATDAGFDGIVIRNRLMGFEILGENSETVTIKVAAGENWDETVKKTVELGLSGIEALSGIPGTVGAAPVQNIGAYGQEVADVIQSVEAYDTQSLSAVTLTADACGFSYRHSVFRGEAYERYIITAVIMKLHKRSPEPPFYEALQRYFDEHAITDFTPQVVRDGVLAIRFAKLPDPAAFPNSGSFFKNAIVEPEKYQALRQQHPDMPSYSMPDGRYKIPTGWLIEQCGFKGHVLHGIRVHDKNALVLINESAESYSNLEAAMQEIIDKVAAKFQITIEREPLLLASPASATSV